jgi:hypothetical protein
MSTFSVNESSNRSPHLVALLVGIVALALAGLGGWFNPRRFFEGYLWAYNYWWLVSVGCLGVGLIDQLTGGGWGDAGRPFIHAGARTLPLVALGFIPIALGLDHIYPWTATGYFDGQPHTENRQWYLSAQFFVGRAAFYLSLAVILAVALTRGDARDRATAGPRRPLLGALGTVVLVLVVTFAAIDWAMSLDPHWFSTIYGGLFIVGALLSAMSFVTVGAARQARDAASNDERERDGVHDLGKLLLAMLMLWAYFSFSQFLIIYSGNLPFEAIWYTRRLSGGWQFLALLLVLLHFAVPFGLLLPREVKRNASTLAMIASGIALVRALDVYWLIVPSFEGRTLRPHWLDPVLFVGLGGIWMFVYLRSVNQRQAVRRADERWAAVRAKN